MSEQRLNYMQEADARLTAILLGGEDGETDEQWIARVKTEIKAMLYESWKNGRAAVPASRSSQVIAAIERKGHFRPRKQTQPQK